MRERVDGDTPVTTVIAHYGHWREAQRLRTPDSVYPTVDQFVAWLGSLFPIRRRANGDIFIRLRLRPGEPY